MKQYQSKADLNLYCANTNPIKNNNTYVKIVLLQYEVTLRILEGKVRLFNFQRNDLNGYDFRPRTNLKSSEILYPFTDKMFQIDQDNGVCVIFLEPYRLYIKLYLNKESKLKIATVANWSKDTPDRIASIMAKDIGIGYEVLFLSIDDDGKYKYTHIFDDEITTYDHKCNYY